MFSSKVGTWRSSPDGQMANTIDCRRLRLISFAVDPCYHCAGRRIARDAGCAGRAIPVVFIYGPDPVKSGLVRNLNHGN